MIYTTLIAIILLIHLIILALNVPLDETSIEWLYNSKVLKSALTQCVYVGVVWAFLTVLTEVSQVSM